MTYQPPVAATPANWYADPADPTQERYWDGTEWTAQVRPATSVATAPPAYTAAPPLPPYYPAPPVPKSGNGFSFAAMILGFIAFLFFPIIIGPIGLIVGYIGKSRGEAKANVGMAVAGIGMVLGIIASVVLMGM